MDHDLAGGQPDSDVQRTRDGAVSDTTGSPDGAAVRLAPDVAEFEWSTSARGRRAGRWTWTGVVLATLPPTMVASWFTWRAALIAPPGSAPFAPVVTMLAHDGSYLLGVLGFVSLPIVVAVASYRIRARELFQAEKLRDQLRQANGTDMSLAHQWQFTQSRIDIYHHIATKQARNSFRSSQMVIAAGMLIIVCALGVVALRGEFASMAAAAVIATVASALAGYIGRTSLRIHQQATQQLRSYFEQPLEFSRMLAAERMLNRTGTSLSEPQRAELLAAILVAAVGRSGVDRHPE